MSPGILTQINNHADAKFLRSNVNKIKYVVGIIAALLGSIVYLFIKKQSAEALLENNEVKSKLNEQDKEKAKNDGLLASEEEKRNNLSVSAEERKNNDVKPGDFN